MQHPGGEAEGERGLLTDWLKPHGSGRGRGTGQGFLSSNAGKTAAGFGVGVLLGGVLDHAWEKHGHFNMGRGHNSYVAPPQQQQHHHHHGGGLLGGMGSSLFSGPPLKVLSANYGGGDCTEKVRDQIRPYNTLEINDGGDAAVYDRLFGDA
jgi:hypothetical protein